MKTSLYIHIPFCNTKCGYCSFFSIGCADKGIPDEYIFALCNEIKIKAHFYKISNFKTVYIGGGTPSLLSEQQLAYIMKTIFNLCEKNNILEITIEANPCDITSSTLEIFQQHGINRLSCGIQALDEKSLQNVNRQLSIESIYNALELIAESWKGIFSADMICALPEQDEKTFLKGLSKLLEYTPDHISMYSLSIEKGTLLAEKIKKGIFSYDYDKADEIWIKGRDFLKKNNFFQYEISNFCKPKKECLHNMTYWRLQNYIGAGAGAFGTIYSNNNFSERINNTKNINKYIKFWLENKEFLKSPLEKEIIDKKTQQFEYFMMGFRTSEGICPKDFERRFNCAFPQNVKKVFQSWQKKQLAFNYFKDEKEYLVLNEKGMLFLNSFLEKII